MDAIGGAIGIPPPEIPVHGVPWRKVVRQLPPRAPRPVRVQVCLDDAPPRMDRRAATAAHRHHRLDQRPLLIGQVRGVAGRGRRPHASHWPHWSQQSTQARRDLSQHVLRPGGPPSGSTTCRRLSPHCRGQRRPRRPIPSTPATRRQSSDRSVKLRCSPYVPKRRPYRDTGHVYLGHLRLPFGVDAVSGRRHAGLPAERGSAGCWTSCAPRTGTRDAGGLRRRGQPRSLFHCFICSENAGSANSGGRAAVKTTTLPSGSAVVRSRVFQGVSTGSST
jgi:hypothetical protein